MEIDKLQHDLQAAIVSHKVPGASVAIYLHGKTYEAAAGVLNAQTQVKTTTDSLFQIGSVTKPITAFMMLQLVEKGLVDLDAPIKKYLPELKLAGREAPDSIRVRHLLCHQSGIDGDYWINTGWGDDCLEKYVAQCGDIPLMFEPGELISYCNCGFMIAGRVIEKVTDKIWDDALREYVLNPMGADHSVTRPHELPRFRVAMGHVVDPATHQPRLTSEAYLHRVGGPAGATLCMSAKDLLAFALVNIPDGKCKDGRSLLSKSLIDEMHRAHDIGVSTFGHPAPGLGWWISTCNETTILGHSGGSIGQNSLIRIVPEKSFAIAMLTNTASGAFDMINFFNANVQAAVGLPPLAPPTMALDKNFKGDLRLYEGTYRNSVLEVAVSALEDKLCAKITAEPAGVTEDATVDTQILAPVNKIVFIFEVEGAGPMPDQAVYFLKPNPNGYPQYLNVSGRILRKV